MACGLLTVAFTSTLAATCEGTVRVQLVLDAQSTVVASVEPNSNSVASLPRPNPVPVIVTELLPFVLPLLGLTLLTVGGPEFEMVSG
jgi:hypothetical protein